MDETAQRDKVSWNIASLHASHIQKLLERGVGQKIKGNHKGAFDSFSGIRDLINCELKKDERTKMDEMEGKILPKVNQWFSAMNNPNPTKTKGLGTSCRTLVRDYLRQIMDYIKELGYLPSKEDRTKMSF